MSEAVGLLWQMDKSMGLVPNIEVAICYHAKKYGREANIVEVNAEDLGNQVIITGGVEIQAVKTVLKGTIWVGVKS